MPCRRFWTIARTSSAAGNTGQIASSEGLFATIGGVCCATWRSCPTPPTPMRSSRSGGHARASPSNPRCPKSNLSVLYGVTVTPNTAVRIGVCTTTRDDFGNLAAFCESRLPKSVTPVPLGVGGVDRRGSFLKVEPEQLGQHRRGRGVVLMLRSPPLAPGVRGVDASHGGGRAGFRVRWRHARPGAAAGAR